MPHPYQVHWAALGNAAQHSPMELKLVGNRNIFFTKGSSIAVPSGLHLATLPNVSQWGCYGQALGKSVPIPYQLQSLVWLELDIILMKYGLHKGIHTLRNR